MLRGGSRQKLVPNTTSENHKQRSLALRSEEIASITKILEKTTGTRHVDRLHVLVAVGSAPVLQTDISPDVCEPCHTTRQLCIVLFFCPANTMRCSSPSSVFIAICTLPQFWCQEPSCLARMSLRASSYSASVQPKALASCASSNNAIQQQMSVHEHMQLSQRHFEATAHLSNLPKSNICSPAPAHCTD